MEKWAIASNSSTYDNKNNNTCNSSLCTPQKATNEMPTPRNTPIVSSSFVHHQEFENMAADKCSIAINTYGLDTSTWSQNVWNGPLSGSGSSNIYHVASSNEGFHDLLCSPNNLLIDQLPSWFDILLMSLPHYNSDDASRQDLQSSGPYLHENHVKSDCFLGNLDEASMLQNDFEQKLSLIHDRTPANHQFESKKAAIFFHDIKNCGVNGTTCFQNVNNDFETKDAQTIDDDQQGISTQSSFYYENQHFNQRKRKNQPQESHVVKRGKLGETYTKLQNLVSPFGKTNQATTLLEAITCIKFLQEKVQALSSPYLKSCTTKSGEDIHKDLKSKGLCLVPFSCTLQLANTDGEDCIYQKLFR